jgi:cytochrome bd-type quinol oxidase subunit 2
VTDENEPAPRRTRQKPMVITMSQTLMFWGHGALALGSILAVILQNVLDLDAWPEFIGVPTPALILLIPIWTLLSAGILVSFVAWISHPDYHQELEFSATNERPDWHEYSPFTRHLGGFTAALFCVAAVGAFCFLLAQDELDLKAIAGVYGMNCAAAFTCYLIWFYNEDRDRVTASYLKMLWQMWAFVLIPLAWPLVIILNIRLRKRNGERQETVEQ